MMGTFPRFNCNPTVRRETTSRRVARVGRTDGLADPLPGAANPWHPSTLLFTLILASAFGCGGGSGPNASRDVTGLRTQLTDADPERRADAAFALGQRGSESKAAVQELIAALKDEHLRVRLQAAVALGRIGPAAAEAVPALVAALRSSESTLRRQAAAALGGIGSAARAALPALEQARQDPAPIVRQAAEEAVARIKPKG